MKSRHSRATLAAIALVLLVGRAHALTADSADDVCPLDADPCNVTEVVEVVAGSTLDFASRDLHVGAAGCFEFPGGTGKILAGTIDATSSGEKPIIVASGGGTVTVHARRDCSGGPSEKGCLSDYDCQLGTCSARRCATRPASVCDEDADCVGVCNLHRCSNTSLFVRCGSNADCNFGPCGSQLTCSSFTDAPQECSIDGDCDFGTCSVGEGNVSIGSISGRRLPASESPAGIIMKAADSIVLAGPIDLSSGNNESDGGDLRIETFAGDVTMSAGFKSRGGGQASGGSLDVRAGRDATFAGTLDLTGGAYDGGSLDIAAERDIRFQSDADLSSKSGSGYGGFMYMDAGRDVHIGKSDGPLRIRTDGHTDHLDFGAGGDVEAFAGNDLFVSADVRIRAFGAKAGGDAGNASFSAGGDLVFAGEFLARARGPESVGGFFYADTGDELTISESATIDLRAKYGGSVFLYSGFGDLTFAGLIRTSGSSDYETGSIQFESCSVTFAGTTDNRVDGGYSEIYAHGRLEMLNGSQMLAPKGDNFLRYPDSITPVLDGVITPSPIVIDTYYSPCPTCGDSVLEYGEDCDDGNAVGGDGCDDDCRIE